MLCTEIIVVCSQVHTKHINTVCGQRVEFLNIVLGCAISGFHCAVAENCALLDYYAASSGNFLPTFPDNLSVASGTRILDR
jgi:hypothetical protein